MPTYTTIEYIFSKSDSYASIVGSFYNAICTCGVLFEKVFPWGCDEHLTLEEIVYWNQGKLNADFKLGFTENVSNNYRQILLSGTPYSSCRVFISNDSESFSFHLIVPENEAEELGLEELKCISRNVWDLLPVKCIQTYDELSDHKTFNEIEDCSFPATDYFSFSLFDNEFRDERYDKVLLERGYLFERKEPNLSFDRTAQKRRGRSI